MDPFTIFLLVAALIMVWSFRSLIVLFVVAVAGAVIAFLAMVAYFVCNATARVMSFTKRLFK